MSGDRGIMMSRNRSYVVVLVLLTLIAGLSGVLGNVASSTLPVAWQPYLWLAWPLFVILLLATVGLVIWQARLEHKITVSGETGREKPTPVLLPVPQIPNNLPPRTEFIGRDAEKARVHEALQSRSYLVSIDGIGGIGKTSLALEVVHECLRASKGADPSGGIARFDGFLWTTAKDRDLTLNTLLDTVARTLDYPGIVQQPMEEKRDAVRKLLQHRPYLLIVDNFETIADSAVRDFLLDLPEPSKTLITTREQKLRQVRAISLKGLTEPEALALIRNEGRRLALESLERAEDRVLLYLYEATGGAPLAIKWAVGQIKQKGQSLDTVLAALHEARGDIFDNIFARSWNLLSMSTRQVLIVMPIFATSASRAGIEAASDVHHFALDEALGQLVEMSLVDATDELDLTVRRYGIHPLTRSFAGAWLPGNPIFEREARMRLAGYYIQRSREERGKEWGQVSGFPWFEAELPNITLTVEWANQAQIWNVVISVFDYLYYFLGTRGYWHERIKYGQMALEAAREAGDQRAIANCQYTLGWVLYRQGRHGEAEALLRSCIQSYLSLGEGWNAAWAMVSMARSAIAQGNLDQARQVINQAVKVTGETGYEAAAPGILTAQGHIELQSGNLEGARSLLLQALEATRRKEFVNSIGSRQIDLGHVALAQGRLEEATLWFQKGLESSQQYLRQDNIAKATFGLSRVHALRGNKSEALGSALSAREQFERMGMKHEMSDADAFLHELESSKGQHESS